MQTNHMTDFWASDAGKCASVAKSFLEGAQVLDAAQSTKGRLLFRPTLALAGHGLEQMLKACLYINGCSPPTRGREGHNILPLWVSDVCQPLRERVFFNAKLVAEVDRAEGKYPDVPDNDKVISITEEYVIELCKLHGGVGYPLRYAGAPDQTAPRTPLLVKSLWRTSDDLVKRPSEFDLRRFHEQE